MRPAFQQRIKKDSQEVGLMRYIGYIVGIDMTVIIKEIKANAKEVEALTETEYVAYVESRIKRFSLPIIGEAW